jgi:hypothetical protein
LDCLWFCAQNEENCPEAGAEKDPSVVELAKDPTHHRFEYCWLLVTQLPDVSIPNDWSASMVWQAAVYAPLVLDAKIISVN